MLQIHKASAGSGKTFSLTREYLRLLLAEKDPESGRYRLHPPASYGLGKPKHHGAILAVTFTNKATEEMTARIIGELALLACPPHGKRSPYADGFIADFGTDEPTLQAHAEMALRDLLHNFTWFNVSTIDSFFQRVLNTFTRELELTPTHGVELDDRYVLGVATAKLLASINSDRPAADPADDARRKRLEKWLRQYMLYQLNEGNSFNLLSQTSQLNTSLVGYMSLFFNEQYKLHRAEIDGYLADPSRLEDFYRRITDPDTLGPATEELQRRCIAMKAKGNGLINRFLVVNIDKFIDSGVKASLTATWHEAIENPEKRPKSAKATLDESLDAELLSLLVDVSALIRTAALHRQMTRYTFLLGLFGELSHFLEEYRQEHDALLLSDTGDLLNRIINEEETPFIYERMGSAIRHYLIDEFQDTSQMQWENLRPLLLESLSEGNDNLIIGDEKQCIYRFRNSDPKLLGTDVERLVRGRFPADVALRGVDITENCNWRSSEPVVRFNNTLFRMMAPMMDDTLPGTPVSGTYAGLIQMIPERSKGTPGYVRVEFLTSGPAGEGATDDTDSDDDDMTADELQYRRLVAEIDRQLSAGYRPADIAVLVRKTRQGKQFIARLMDTMEHDPEWTHGQVPIVSSDSMSISLSPAVKMIINVLRLVTQPSKVKAPDDASAAPRLNSASYRRYRLLHRFELCRFDMTEVTDSLGRPVTGPDGRPEMRRLTAVEAFAKAVEATSAPPGEATDPQQRIIDAELLDLAAMESPTLSSMTERIIGRLLTPDAREKEFAFIAAFQDLVLDFSEYGNNNLSEFLKWWDQSGSRTNVAAPDGLDAINVMTIHKAKGLEFECVHVPFCSFPPVKDHDETLKSISWYELDPQHFQEIPPELVPPLFPLPNRRANKEWEALCAQASQWESEQKTDSLNITYVAFTRAVSELNVYCDASHIFKTARKVASMKASGKAPSDIRKAEAAADNRDSWLMSDYILRAIQDCTPASLSSQPLPPEAKAMLAPLQPMLQVTGSGATVFEMGAPTTPRRPAPQQDSPQACHAAESDSDMLYAELLDTYRVFEHSEICADLDFEDLVNFNFDDDRHRGIFLHAVLSRVRHRSDLPRALDAMAYRYRITPVQKQGCLGQLAQALDDPRVLPWFENFTRVLNERTLTAVFERRRPDRVVWLADGSIAVIDYKFGQQHRPEYQQQVRDYVNLLSFAGYPGARGYLWFPLEGTIHRVV